ncbi:MAG: SPOR domain-containing protein [Treponema sp.]|nr:SPOR domain-containing protein [Treponema sp.]
MEQKKTLWIIAAVGAFLLVVLGTAGILYSPARSPSPAIASVAPVEKSKSPAGSGWTNQVDIQPPAPVAAQGDVPAPRVTDMIVLADNTTVYNIPKNETSDSATTIDLNALKNGYLTDSQVQPAAQPQNINITVNVPEVKAPEAPAEKPAKVAEAPVKAVKVQPAPKSEPVKEAPKAAPKAAKSEKSVNVTVKGNASVKVETEVKKTQFWVQVASYSNKKGAENARAILDSNKIPADVFTYQDNKSRLYYRVRVGPYTTKSEAEYWRARIEQIEDFAKAQSYVTSTTN